MEKIQKIRQCHRKRLREKHAAEAERAKGKQMERRTLLLCGGASLLAGCSGRWVVDYEQGLSQSITKSWRVKDVQVIIPDGLTVSNENSFAPNADIVWHGEPFGNRRQQVANLMTEALTRASEPLQGGRDVVLASTMQQFHAVTPAAVARAPGAVHNIAFHAQVWDAKTRDPLTEAVLIEADLEANVGAAAVTAALEGRGQRVRIVEHVARVTRGWLGYGPDQRRSFRSVGR